jgi:acyl-CoA synthetase (AMP-forming)/AMP-acid ligase II
MCKTLVEALEARLDGDKGINFISGTDKEKFVTYKDLYDCAAGILYNLQNRGLKCKDFLILQLDDNEMFLKVFWACLLGGIIPIPVTLGVNTEYRKKVVRIWHILDGAYVVADGNFNQDAVELEGQDGFKSSIINIEEICEMVGKGRIYQHEPGDTAFIQFSSGSTGDPKGVILTHENLMTNINAMILGLKCKPSESGISWMPLTHDMGMIGCHLLCAVRGMNLHLMPTPLFIRNPLLWMKKINEQRINLTCSPNFGYHYFLKHLKPEACEGWDLSCIRIIINGAESIDRRLMLNFLDTMEKYGVKKSVMFNTYGMAEASLAVTFPHAGEGLSAVYVDRGLLQIGREITYLEDEDSPNALALVELGYPVQDCSIRICDENNNALGENIVGNIQIKGLNVTKGYFNNAEATRRLILEDGWLNTGDLGFTRNGRLFVTGREKDMIILNGQNFYPHDIEQVAVETGGISLGEVAAGSVYNSEMYREEVNLYVLYKKKLDESFIQLSQKLTEGIVRKMGIGINEVIPIKKMPKTTSGKIQRYKLSEEYKNGEFNAVIMEIKGIKRDIAGKKSGDTGITDTRKIILEIVLRLGD